MFGNNAFYKNYHRYNYNYNNYATNRYNSYNNATFTPMYNYFYEQSLNNNDNNQQYTQDNTDTIEYNNINSINNEFEKRENNDKKNFRVGPIQIEDNNINAFGFSIAIDDLIIIGLIILLFFQSDKDYTLIIILGLMLFNISFSNLDFFRGL